MEDAKELENVQVRRELMLSNVNSLLRNAVIAVQVLPVYVDFSIVPQVSARHRDANLWFRFLLYVLVNVSYACSLSNINTRFRSFPE